MGNKKIAFFLALLLLIQSKTGISLVKAETASPIIPKNQSSTEENVDPFSIGESVFIGSEEVDEMALTLHKELGKEGEINNCTPANCRRYVTVININDMSNTNPELVAALLGVQLPEAFVNDSFKVASAIYAHNRNIYENNGNTEELIRPSKYLIDPDAKRQMQIVESLVDSAYANRNNAEELNKVVKSLVFALTDNLGQLHGMDEGVKFASMTEMDLLVYLQKGTKGTAMENISYVDEVTLGRLMNEKRMEDVMPGIFAYLRHCSERAQDNTPIRRK